jgi:hypothetical protein
VVETCIGYCKERESEVCDGGSGVEELTQRIIFLC